MAKKIEALFWPLIVSGLLVGGYFLLKNANLTIFQPAGDIADAQKSLLSFALLLSAAVVIPVFTLLIVFSIRYREGNKKAPYRPDDAHNAKLEIAWWGIPIVIIVILASATLITTYQLDPYKKLQSANKTLEVQVVALRWKWLFLYPSENIATVNKLVIPKDTPVHFSISADAPMSAFWVPALGSQIYAMNGMNSQLNLIASKTGTFKGYNTNISGEGYADMTFDVKAVDGLAFSNWKSSAKTSKSSMNKSTYQTIAKPSVIKTPKTYALTDATLYDAIMRKYMMGHSDNPTDMPAKTDHSMHDMETMHE